MSAGRFLADVADGRLSFEEDLTWDGLVEATVESIEEVYFDLVNMKGDATRKRSAIHLILLIDRIGGLNGKRAVIDFGKEGFRWLERVKAEIGINIYGVDPQSLVLRTSELPKIPNIPE